MYFLIFIFHELFEDASYFRGKIPGQSWLHDMRGYPAAKSLGIHCTIIFKHLHGIWQIMSVQDILSRKSNITPSHHLNVNNDVYLNS